MKQTFGEIHRRVEFLVEEILPRDDFLAQIDRIQSILLASRLFVRPTIFFNRLANRLIDFLSSKTRSQAIDLINKFLFILSQWTKSFPSDFRDEQMIDQIEDLFQKINQFEWKLRPSTDFIWKNLREKLNKIEQWEVYFRQQMESSSSRKRVKINLIEANKQSRSTLQLAQQLLHIELDLVKSICLEEFVQYSINQNKSKEEIELERSNNKDCHADRKRTSALEIAIQWSNHLTLLVTTQIVKHRNKRNRIRSIEYFIDLAYQTFVLNNFNSMFSIMGGLNKKAVQRLKRTWSQIDTTRFDDLNKQLDLTRNFSNYRLRLKNSFDQAELNSWKDNHLVVPCLSLLIQDVSFILTHSDDFIDQTRVNLQKYHSLMNYLSDHFLRCQISKCSFERDDSLIHSIFNSTIYSESTLLLASFDCESPNNEHEKLQRDQLIEESSKNDRMLPQVL